MRYDISMEDYYGLCQSVYEEVPMEILNIPSPLNFQCQRWLAMSFLTAYDISFLFPKADKHANSVPEIKDDQPRNPYTEIKLLSGHSDRIHLVTKADEKR